jgi:drug/metabolite transporter (DMT)-like permease
MSSGLTETLDRNPKLRWIARTISSGIWILVFWAIWGPLHRLIGKSGWPHVLQAIFMGVANAAAYSITSYLDRRIGLRHGAFERFSAFRLALITLFVAVLSYMATGNGPTLPPWLMALILVGFVALIAIVDDKARRAAESSPVR